MNDETIFDQNEVKEEKQGNAPLSNDETVLDEQQNPKPEEAAGDKKKRDYKTAGIAGAAGVAGATLGVLFPFNNVLPEEPNGGNGIADDVVTNPTPSASGQLTGHDMELATGVNDSMSFSQAFAAARQEVGPGGLFVWHGNTYGTYYANEWNAMTPEDREQYWTDVHHTMSNVEIDPQTNQNQHVENNVNPDEVNNQAEANNQQNEANNQQDEPTDQQNEENNHAEEPETLVINEENILTEVDLDENGNIDMVVVHANGNESPDLIVDTTGDGTLDTLYIDPTDVNLDDNGQIVVEGGEAHQIAGVEVIATELPTPDADVIVLDENDVYDALDLDENGQIDTLVANVNGNEIPDLIVDTTGDGNMDTLVLDAFDESGELVLDENKVSDIGGVVVNPEQEIDIQENEMIADNQDIDDLASLTHDSDITIDNDMDMSDFA